MYYIETFANDGYHKYVASMTGAAVKGIKPDEGVYLFEDESACNRAIGAINKMYGSDIFTIAVKKKVGQETEVPKLEKTIKEKQKQSKIKEVQPPSTATAEKNILQNLLRKTAIPVYDPTSSTVQPQAQTLSQVPLTDIVKATTVKRSESRVAAKSSDFSKEVDINDAANIGMEQYALDESVGEFEVTAAKPPVSRRRGGNNG